jgi:transcription elongation factor GreB
MNKKKNYISQGGFDKLASEHQHLTRVERPKTCEVIAWAAGNGDRSENADYQYGKRRLREIDRRLRFLSQRINDAEIVDYTKNSDDKIRFGATVTIIDEEGEAKSYTIVGVDEIDTESGKISWQSPIGKALMGKETGDEITVQTPEGPREVSIEEVEYSKWD